MRHLPLLSYSQFVFALILGIALAHPMVGQQSAVKDSKKSTNGTTQVWYGELDVKLAVLRLEFHVTKMSDGTFAGHMISLDQGRAKLPLDTINVTDKQISLTINRAQLEFTGDFDASRKVAKGTYSQLGKKYPFSIELVEEDPELKHTQTWTGRMKAGPQTFDFQIRVYEKDGMPPRVLLDSFSENDFDRRAKLIHDAEGGVTVEVPSTKAKIVGTLNDSFDRLDGKWHQRGGKFDIVLRKIALEQTRDPKAKRPQTPKTSFKYKTTEHTIKNQEAGLALCGSLTVPNGDGPFPVIVTISGSGPQDRDETIFGHKPFYVIADHLGKRKIATFRYDERGVGESTGNFSTATSKDFADDVDVIVDYLKTQETLDPKRIILVGHSEGGIIAPMVAARRSDIAGIVLLAGPGVPGLEIVLNQTRLIAKAEGAEEKDLEAQRFILEELIKGVESAEEFAAVVNEKFKDQMSEEEAEKTLAAIQQAQAQFDSPWFKFFLKHDPRVDLRKVKVPVLSIVGEKDLQVDPNLNLPAIEAALQVAGNNKVQSKVLPKLNHLFQECKTGSPSEYAAIEQTFAPAALEVLTTWLLENFGDGAK